MATLQISQKQKIVILEHSLVCSRWEKITLPCLPAYPYSPSYVPPRDTNAGTTSLPLCQRGTNTCAQGSSARGFRWRDLGWDFSCTEWFFCAVQQAGTEFLRGHVISPSSLATTRYDGCYGNPFSLNGKVLNAYNALDRCTGIFFSLLQPVFFSFFSNLCLSKQGIIHEICLLNPTLFPFNLPFTPSASFRINLPQSQWEMQGSAIFHM